MELTPTPEQRRELLTQYFLSTPFGTSDTYRAMSAKYARGLVREVEHLREGIQAAVSDLSDVGKFTAADDINEVIWKLQAALAAGKERGN